MARSLTSEASPYLSYLHHFCLLSHQSTRAATSRLRALEFLHSLILCQYTAKVALVWVDTCHAKASEREGSVCKGEMKEILSYHTHPSTVKVPRLVNELGISLSICTATQTWLPR